MHKSAKNRTTGNTSKYGRQVARCSRSTESPGRNLRDVVPPQYKGWRMLRAASGGSALLSLSAFSLLALLLCVRLFSFEDENDDEDDGRRESRTPNTAHRTPLPLRPLRPPLSSAISA
jgi:hypothetical protein